MTNIKIGIIREDKNPPDMRVALPPIVCQKIKEKFANVSLFVQPSKIRAFYDNEYSKIGIELKEDLSDCDILFGVKEVPKENLIANKHYFFFSHTIKKQAYNRTLLQEILAKKIQLSDYECLRYENGQRILGFGRHAGIVGAYNAMIGYGKKLNLFDLKAANKCKDFEEVKQEMKKVILPENTKIVITGSGRVSNGAIEILDLLGIQKITNRNEFVSNKYPNAVYFQATVKDYVKHNSKKEWEDIEFFKQPENFEANFKDFLSVSDILISGHYWDPKSPILFEKEDVAKDDFNVKLISDITCDIDGSIPTTVRPCTIADPFYDFDAENLKDVAAFGNNKLTVMAVDNLPCELPRDASEDFGNALFNEVIPYLLDDKDGRIKNASITKNGELTAPYLYLSDFVK